MNDATSTYPRLLLLCDEPPGDGNVGQLFLRELCDSYPSDQLAFGIVGSRGGTEDERTYPGVPRTYASWTAFVPPQAGPAWIAALRKHTLFRWRTLQARGRVQRPLTRLAQQFRPDLVWGILSSPTLYRTAPAIASQLGKPLVTTVWDPPEGVGLQYGLDRFSRRVAARQLESALRKSVRCSVISERMSQEYSRFCDTRIILRHGIADADKSRPRTGELDSKQIRIGFCGTLYAEDTWRSFLAALDHLEWRIDDLPVVLVVVGRRIPFLEASRPASVEFLGWRPTSDTLQLMNSCHFTYLPYWFLPAYADSVRLCFPTKLTTYMTAGRPTFYHGPQDASVVDFFRKFEVGLACHETRGEKIAEAIRSFARRVLGGFPYGQAIERAIQEELSLSVFRHRFHQLLGIS